MARDHYIPAVVLGHFSSDNSGPYRLRRVAIGRRGKREPYVARAETIGYEGDLYRLNHPGRTTVDDTWAGIEQRLPEAICSLERSQPVSANLWLRVLVPYVAALFVRGREWEARFSARPAGKAAIHAGLDVRSNANGARMLELQRLLAPVMCARWVILHSLSPSPILNNNLGLAGTTDLAAEEDGWVVPLSTRVAIGLFPSDRRTVVAWRQDSWHAVLEHTYGHTGILNGLNTAIAAFAREFVIGPDTHSVQLVVSHIGAAPDHTPLMQMWPFTDNELLANEQLWHRLVSLTHRNTAPPVLTADTDIHTAIDWDSVTDGWSPTLIVELNPNTRLRAAGIELHGRAMRLSLHD